MIICLCQNISDRSINALIERGICSVKKMQNFCAIGQGCGKCVAVVKSLVEKQQGFVRAKCCATSPCQKKTGEEHGQGFGEKRHYRVAK